jgi:hypothetical protein
MYRPDNNGMQHPYYYRYTILQQLGLTIQANIKTLELMNEAGFTPGVAWVARNILELTVWTAYCRLSEETAQRFFEDGKRDAITGMDIPDELIRADARDAFKATKEQLLTQAALDGVENPTEYQRVASAAKFVNYQYFGKINMLLSKWAHPTAMAVLEQSPPPELRNLFYRLATMWADTSLTAIGTVLASWQ